MDREVPAEPPVERPLVDVDPRLTWHAPTVTRIDVAATMLSPGTGFDGTIEGYE